jgi:hypothetical protein
MAKNHRIQDIIDNVKQITMSPSSLEILMDFERVLDENNLYAFAHWKYAELVQGPEISKYRVKCVFMLPLSKMPDPSGAERLLPYGAIVKFMKSWLTYPIKIESQSDYRDGVKKAKLSRTRVWLIEIDLPKHLMKDIKKGSDEIMASEIDMSDVEEAYEQGVDSAQDISNTDESMQ